MQSDVRLEWKRVFSDNRNLQVPPSSHMESAIHRTAWSYFIPPQEWDEPNLSSLVTSSQHNEPTLFCTQSLSFSLDKSACKQWLTRFSTRQWHVHNPGDVIGHDDDVRASEFCRFFYGSQWWLLLESEWKWLSVARSEQQKSNYASLALTVEQESVTLYWALPCTEKPGPVYYHVLSIDGTPNLPANVLFRKSALIDSVPDIWPSVDGFLRITSMASRIVNFEYVSIIFGSAPCAQIK